MLRILQTDITKLAVDAIVNAANQGLRGGGGVDGAIHRAAGKQLLAACQELGGCATGDAKATPGFNLPARYVFHAVGPRWRDGSKGEPEKLASCYRRTMELTKEYRVRSIAFPAISCGAYRFPHHEAAAIAIGTISAMMGDCGVADAILAVRDLRVLEAYQEVLARRR